MLAVNRLLVSFVIPFLSDVLSPRTIPTAWLMKLGLDQTDFHWRLRPTITSPHGFSEDDREPVCPCKTHVTVYDC